MEKVKEIKKRLEEAGLRYWANDNISEVLQEGDKEKLIEEAIPAFENVLQHLLIDTKTDPNSIDTARRMAKMYINEIMSGRYDAMPNPSAFPNYIEGGYEGMLVVRSELTSLCSHHHQTITGKVHIGYIASENGTVVGLSKLNRIVEHFGRRGAIQEQLTVAIHNAVDKICTGNLGVAVLIEAGHNCVSCRGVKHQGASMKTSKLSGSFMEEDSARAEFYEFCKGYRC